MQQFLYKISVLYNKLGSSPKLPQLDLYGNSIQKAPELMVDLTLLITLKPCIYRLFTGNVFRQLVPTHTHCVFIATDKVNFCTTCTATYINTC